MKLVIADDGGRSSANEQQMDQDDSASNEGKSSISKKELEVSRAELQQQKSLSPQIPLEGVQANKGKGPGKLLAKRSNPDSLENNAEFQQPLPKKSF